MQIDRDVTGDGADVDQVSATVNGLESLGQRLVRCARPQGERSPIILTPLRFDAYGRNCDIASIDETGSGYVAVLRCAGRPQTERVHMGTSGDVMNLTYVDQDMKTVKLARCPGSPRAPDPANPLEKMMKKDGAETPPAAPH